MDTTKKLPLDMVYHWEATSPNSLYMTQPIGDGKVVEYTWGRAVDEARRMAAYLKSLNLPEKSRIGLISKNCAQWVMTDWAIWMAGHISVPLYPTLNADTVNYILNHAECDVLFVGKLDDWDSMKSGVPESVRCISYPLSPPNDFETWDDIESATARAAIITSVFETYGLDMDKQQLDLQTNVADSSTPAEKPAAGPHCEQLRTVLCALGCRM